MQSKDWEDFVKANLDILKQREIEIHYEHQGGHLIRGPIESLTFYGGTLSILLLWSLRGENDTPHKLHFHKSHDLIELRSPELPEMNEREFEFKIPDLGYAVIHPHGVTASAPIPLSQALSS